MEKNNIRPSWIQRLRRALGTNRRRRSSMSMLSTRGGIPIRQTKLAPDGLEFSEDVSEARWVEERLSNFGTLRSLLPEGFPAYARMFHPAYLKDDRDRPGAVVYGGLVDGTDGPSIDAVRACRRSE